jgi:hypothetical protein
MSKFATKDAGAQSALPEYEKPSITIMNEEEVLSSFQITQAFTTWWTM